MKLLFAKAVYKDVKVKCTIVYTKGNTLAVPFPPDYKQADAFSAINARKPKSWKDVTDIFCCDDISLFKICNPKKLQRRKQKQQNKNI